MPPATSEHPSPDSSRAPQVTGISAAVLILACLLIGVVAFVAGFAIGQNRPEADSPIVSPDSAMPGLKDVAKPPVPVRSWIPSRSSDDSPAPAHAGPEATLRTFLEAGDWAARSNHVLFPENLRDRMEKRAAKSGDGPIETTDITLLHITPQAHIFNVATPRFPKGFPVAVARSNNGWKVDWETFIEFHEDLFSHFAAGKEGKSGVFHLMVNPVESENPEELFARFRLNPPMPNREQSGYVQKNGIAHARLSNIFDEQAGLPDADFRKLLDGSGPPMVLALSYRENSQGQSYIQIDDVIAIGWGPEEP